MNTISFMLFVVGALCLGIFNSSLMCYLAFIYFLVGTLIQYTRNRQHGYIICIILASIIAPSNYIIYAVLAIVGIWTIPVNLKLKFSVSGLLLLLYLGFHTFFHMLTRQEKVYNLIFSVLYYFPLVFSYLKFQNFEFTQTDNELVLDFLKKSLIVQIIAILSKFLFHFHVVTQFIDFDWVTGTFGDYQGNILLFYAMFCLTIFWNEYQQIKKDITFVILAAFIGIMTGSIALLIIYIASFCLYSFFLNKTTLKKFAATVCIIVVGVVLFVLVTPEWIKNYIVLLVTSPESRTQYITKLQDYHNVFVKIPKQDLSFFVFGNGLGMYCSRAALTCSGRYVAAYSKLFPVSVSEYTASYIIPKLEYVYANRLGSMDAPFCSVMAVFSELGIIGLLLMVLLFARLYRKNGGDSRIFLLFFALSCFVDNYLEFSRVVPLVFICGLFQFCKVQQSEESL